MSSLLDDDVINAPVSNSKNAPPQAKQGETSLLDIPSLMPSTAAPPPPAAESNDSMPNLLDLDISGSPKPSKNSSSSHVVPTDTVITPQKRENKPIQLNKTSIYELLITHLDFNSLLNLSQVNKEARKAVSAAPVFTQIAKLDTQSNQNEDNLSISLKFMKKTFPVIKSPRDYWDDNQTTFQVAVIGKAFVLAKLIEYEDHDNRFQLFINHLKLDIIDQIEPELSSSDNLKSVLRNAETWVEWSQDTDFRNRIFDLILKPKIMTFRLEDVLVFSDDTDMGKTVSQRKFHGMCQSLCANLLEIRFLAANNIPPAWSDEFWMVSVQKVLTQFETFLRNLFSVDSPLISESVYVDVIPKLPEAFQVLYTNELINDKIKLQPLIETQIMGPLVDDFVIRQNNYIRNQALERAQKWRESVIQRESETETDLWKHVPKKQDKTNFMSSFKWAFKSSDQKSSDEAANEVYGTEKKLPQTEFEAQTAILMSKLKGMDHLISMEFAIGILELCRSGINKLKHLDRLSRTDSESLFVIFIDVVGQQHTKLAFEKAIKILNSYDPKRYGRLMVTISEDDVDDRTAVEPLAIFTELINIGDLIQQMGQVFFDQELVQTRLVKPSDFGSASVRAKRTFEQMLDDMIAEGLSRGIDVLVDQVEFILVTEQLGSDYYPPPTEEVIVGTTKAAQEVIALVGSHLKMLRDCTEKDLFDVFQQEVGIRLYHALCKHFKNQTISVDGGITLIADANAYYGFIMTLKQTVLLPYYETLKRISQLFLIDGKEYKQIAMVISDSSRYNGLLTIEEVVEFVKRRADWPKIKLKVEKVLYGLFVCVIC